MGDATIMVDFLDKSYLEELSGGWQPELRMLQSMGIVCYTKSQDRLPECHCGFATLWQSALRNSIRSLFP